MQKESFKLLARVSSANPEAVEPVLRRLTAKGTVRKEKDEFIVEAEMAAIMGAVRTDDAELSSIKSLELIREDSKSLLIRIPKSEMILAVVFDKSKAGTELSDNIRRVLGLK